jgi:hypothetical protein
MVLYGANGRLDTQTDPWFNLGPKDNLALLAPGLDGEVAIDFRTWGSVTAVQFGLLPDG